MGRYPPPSYNPHRFQPLHGGDVEESDSKKLWWMLGGALLIFIILIYILFSGLYNPESSNSEKNIDEEQQTPTISQSLISCKNQGCFIDASQNCSKANFTNTQSLDFLGLNITTTTYYEILSRENNKCLLKFQTEEQHINLTDELIQQMVDSGTTMDEIRQQEQVANENADILEGRDGTCKFKDNNLKIFLTKIFGSDFSGSVSCSTSLTPEGTNTSCEYTGDWELVESCEGEYFSQQF